MGKAMWYCGQCQGKLCQACDDRHVGCALDEESHVCKTCFETVFGGVMRYCDDEDCTSCLNKSPQFRAKAARQAEAYAAFAATVDRKAWRAKHKPIDFKSMHQGKYLIDLYLSDSNFQSGYIDWLIKAGADKGYRGPRAPSFMDFVKEAHELKEASRKLRKQPKRDLSPTRKNAKSK